MHSFEKIIKSTITDKQLLVKGDVVLVGVSGGPDSTALLRVLWSLQQAIGFSLAAVYVDHGLRPEETPGEKDFLTKLCGELHIPLDLAVVDVAHEVAIHKESTEQAARKLRYQVFARVGQACGASKIAVGHTADDQVEEVLLRLLRGTARSGLSGMKFMRDKLIVRPLLQVAKDDLYVYLQDRGISYMEDSSNGSTIYLRNQVRLDILPFLRRYNPSIDANLRNMALILQDEEDLLAQQTSRAWDDLVITALEPDGLPAVQWGCSDFALLHVAMQRRLTEKMFIVMESPPSADKIKQLLYLIQHGEGGSSLHFAHGLRALKKKGRMRFWYPQGKTSRKGNLFDKSSLKE